SEARAWPAATAQRGPMTGTVAVVACRGAVCCEETQSRLIVVHMIRARAPPSQAPVLRSDREATADRRLDLDHRRHIPRARVREHGLPLRDPGGGRDPR